VRVRLPPSGPIRYRAPPSWLNSSGHFAGIRWWSSILQFLGLFIGTGVLDHDALPFDQGLREACVAPDQGDSGEATSAACQEAPAVTDAGVKPQAIRKRLVMADARTKPQHVRMSPTPIEVSPVKQPIRKLPAKVNSEKRPPLPLRKPAQVQSSPQGGRPRPSPSEQSGAAGAQDCAVFAARRSSGARPWQG
jgi:hypothetical protein